MRTVKITATACTDEHGGPNNAATVYGHFGSTKVCVRVLGTDVWVFNIKAPS